MPSIEMAAAQTKAASSLLAGIPAQTRTRALEEIASRLAVNRESILAANQSDVAQAAKLLANKELSQQSFERLKLDHKKLDGVIEGVKQLALSEDLIGRISWGMKLDQGLDLFRVTCPIGVIAVIFEARPDVLPQIVSLAVRSANAVILKGGKEAELTNRHLFAIIQEALDFVGLPANSVMLLESRLEIMELLKADKFVDLVIPRGSNELVKHIQENTRIPVLGHAEGLCHIYVDKNADLQKAIRLILDAKTSYPSACNSVETVLIHTEIAKRLLSPIIDLLESKNVQIRLDEKAMSFSNNGSYSSASESDWRTEYCDLILAIKVVADLDEAVEHINKYGSKHTEVIVTEDKGAFDLFFSKVDAAGVYLNASTRFADGFRYGFGAEVGISTGKLHPRGPVGVEGLLTYKYKLIGDGHISEDYQPGGKSTFIHQIINSDDG